MKSLDWMTETVRYYEPSLRVIQSIDTETVPGIGTFSIDYDGNGSYTDDNKNVHLGIKGIYNLYNKFLNSEADVYSAVDFIRIHENCHLYYTGGKSWTWGILSGVRTMAEYMADKEGFKPKKFRSERDLENFMVYMNKKYCINISEFLGDVAHHIIKSMEDGRIERIQSAKEPGFADKRTYNRGLVFWNESYAKYDPYSAIEDRPDIQLSIILNQVLSLSTCQLYGKGFVKAYGTSPLMKVMNNIMPFISEGYMSKTTRGVAEAPIKICDVLAPLAYDSLLYKAEHRVEPGFQDIIAAVLAQIATILGNEKFSNSDLGAQEDDTDSYNSTLPNSDLVITLPDEVYDKLMDKASKKDGDEEKEGNSIQIRREHPLPPKEDEKEMEDDKGNKSHTSDPSGEGNSEKSSDSNKKESSTSSAETDSKDSSESDNSDSSSAGNSNSSAGEKETDNKDSKDSSDSRTSESLNNNPSGSTSDNSDNSDNTSNSESQENDFDQSGDREESTDGNPNSSIPENNQGNHSKSSKGHNVDNAEDQIMKAMQEAAEKVRAESEENLSRINQANTSSNSKRARTKETVDTSKPISSKEMQDICDFVEQHRAYRLTEKLPPELESKGRTLRKKMEDYFRSRREPAVKNRRNGLLDRAALSKLAKNKTDVFMKKSKSNKTDACVYMLIDNSGSMSGTKRYAACSAAAVIEEGFKTVMPIKIVAFDEWGTINHEVIKNWDEVTNMNCCWNFWKRGRDGDGNEDDKDIRIATREILKRPEQKKIIVVLSDGAPSNTDETRLAIEEARKKGIQVSGIYFEEGTTDVYSSDFVYMYQKDYVCCSLDQILPNLTKIMNKFAH